MPNGTNAGQPDLSAAHDLNPINPGGPDSLPTINDGTGLPGERRPDSPDDPAPAEPKYAETQSPGVNRPPKPPGDYCGPYYAFQGTSGNTWYGSALLFRHINLAKPTLKLRAHDGSNVKEPEWEVLYENVFGMTAWRVNLEFSLLENDGDTTISWDVIWPHDDKDDFVESGHLAIANLQAKWRGGFFSCNGFDATVPVDLAKNLTYTNVWNHLGSVHMEKPLHLLIWGGDQNYIGE